MSDSKTISLTPDWHSYFWYYLAGVLLTPFFGIGLIVLWIVHHKRTSLRYDIHDQFIRITGDDHPEKVELNEIDRVSVDQSWIETKFETGTVCLNTGSRKLNLFGIEHPDRFAEMIRQAITAEEMKTQRVRERSIRTTDLDPGSLEKVDYLTGLWQQGLISDEEFKREKKHFD